MEELYWALQYGGVILGIVIWRSFIRVYIFENTNSFDSATRNILE
jgi:hypothetical protein